MKTKLVTLLIRLGCLCLCCFTASHTNKIERRTVFKVMSYNIHHANPPSRVGFIDLEAIANVINKETPDFVALQEVDVHTKRSGLDISEAALLASKTGMHYYFAKAIDYDGGDYGVLILCRFPIATVHSYSLPVVNGTGGEPRVLATVEANVRGQNLLFACTHLDAQRSDSNRYLQIQAIANILKDEKSPIIIGGDFNAEAGSRIVNKLDEYFTRSCISDCGFTIPSEEPRKTIDFIAFTPNKFIVKEHRVINEKYASDHRPVICTLIFPSEQ